MTSCLSTTGQQTATNSGVCQTSASSRVNRGMTKSDTGASTSIWSKLSLGPGYFRGKNRRWRKLQASANHLIAMSPTDNQFTPSHDPNSLTAEEVTKSDEFRKRAIDFAALADNYNSRTRMVSGHLRIPPVDRDASASLSFFGDTPDFDRAYQYAQLISQFSGMEPPQTEFNAKAKEGFPAVTSDLDSLAI